MKIIYGITASTEHEELKRLVTFLKENSQDDIFVQYDTTKTASETVDMLTELGVKINGIIFRDNFADFKNELNKSCLALGADYVIQLDADEMLSIDFINNIKEIIQANDEVDLFHVPRINTVDGITQEHVQKWGWNVNDKGWINFPDWQGRIYRPHMKWYGKVHERIIGGQRFSILPMEEPYCLLHHKTIEKQESQNNLYGKI